MAFRIPKKPLHSSSSSSAYDKEKDEPPRLQSSVTSCIYLKPDAGGAAAAARRSLDKEVVLHRIRQRKRVNQIRAAIQSLLRTSPDPGDKDGEPLSCWWLDDIFSAP